MHPVLCCAVAFSSLLKLCAQRRLGMLGQCYSTALLSVGMVFRGSQWLQPLLRLGCKSLRLVLRCVCMPGGLSCQQSAAFGTWRDPCKRLLAMDAQRHCAAQPVACCSTGSMCEYNPSVLQQCTGTNSGPDSNGPKTVKISGGFFQVLRTVLPAPDVAFWSMHLRVTSRQTRRMSARQHKQQLNAPAAC